ncbi:hypothetical protein Nepgr_031283 [Nepenthes gracilis]|uniref:Uncharacterized protein n=1 Tax=Nepenthes gracilis TaxID=150966 RepID=A0AAD3TH38_NEPGR|nr:hypothetical protein Nepgr_031283 [Nepenthes gracilis]
MEGQESSEFLHPTGSVDKSKVLSVKPLRSLFPVFSSAPPGVSSNPPAHPSPFVCVPPSGPFPPWLSPFYPFWSPTKCQRHMEGNSSAAMLNNSRAWNGNTTPLMKNDVAYSQTDSGFVEEDGYDSSHDQTAHYSHSFSMHGTDAEVVSKIERQKNKPHKRLRGGQDVNLSVPDTDAVADDFLSKINLMVFDTFQRADGDKDSVPYILMTYDMLRRRITQIEDGRDATPGVTRRPDLRAGTILMNKGIRTNIKKRVGAVPGVEVGDIFFFRMEMCLVGLHAPCMAGIDYMSLKVTQNEEPLAVSIVYSGGYEDNAENGDVLIYSGQGGNIRRKGRQIIEQKLERGNLALEKSFRRGNEVRVIHGVKDVANPMGKVYVYDGLYKIQDSWMENGTSGCSVFKYKLVKLPGQPEAFKLWRLIQQWKEGIVTRAGVILPDLTSGLENIPVSLVNDIDDEKGLAHFTYYRGLKYSRPVNLPSPCSSCNCQGACQPGDSRCTCIQKNGGYLPYTASGVLVNHKSLIHECGPSCPCPPTCRGRVSQAGFKVRLEVFKTKDKGWGLRSWEPIRAGCFICEYAGEVVNKYDSDKFGLDYNDHYIFDATRIFEPLEAMPCDLYVSDNIPVPLVVNSKYIGNVARFMNHSCSPNVFWQPVLRGNNNEGSFHIAFFAIKHISPMSELTYDYGKIQPDTADHRKQKCLCGSIKCRGFFYQ